MKKTFLTKFEFGANLTVHSENRMSKQRPSWRGMGFLLLPILYLAATTNAQEPVAQPNLIEQAKTLDDQAAKLYAEGKYLAAIPLAEQAVAIREKSQSPLDSDLAASLDNLGRLHAASGANDKAEPLYLRALSIREKVLGPEHLDTAKSLNNLANMHNFAGAYTQAEPLYRRALSIREKTLGPEHAETAKSLNNLALLYQYMGKFRDAELMFKRSLAIKEKVLGTENHSTATSLNNLAILYGETGAYTHAEPLYQRALKMYQASVGRDHPDTAASLNNLCTLYLKTSEFTKAESLCQQAFATWETVLGSDHPNVADSLINLAEVLQETGSFAKAESMLERALAIHEKAMGPDHRKTASALHSLASLDLETGNYSRSERLLIRSLAINQRALGPRHPVTAMSLASLAIPIWAGSDPTQALPLFQRAQATYEKISEHYLLSGSESRKRAYMQSLSNEINRYISFHLSTPSHEGIELGLLGILQYKGRVLDAMSDSVARLRQSVQPNDLALFEELASVANKLSGLTYQGPGTLSGKDYQQRLDELADQQEKLEATISSRSIEFRRQITPVSIATVRQSIPPNATLVEWLRYVPYDPKLPMTQQREAKPRYVAYLLSRDAQVISIDVGDAQTIETLVHQYRMALSDSKSVDFKTHSAALYSRIMQPLIVHLKGTQHLLVSPDGSLNLVPMGALLDDQGKYMAQRLEISYLTSGRDLLRFDSTPFTRRPAVLVADPDFGNRTLISVQTDAANQIERSVDLDRGGLLFRPLPKSALEARDIKKLLKLDDTNILLQRDATERNIKQLRGPRILHIASHGFFLNDLEMSSELSKRNPLGQQFASIGENPLLRSGIALTGANPRRSGSNDDGILTSLEASQLDLRGTDLVVLSACDTGVGDVENGEGVYGLRRALVLAGAQTQVTSLWKVSDEATHTLMVDYYERLRNGEGRSKALQHAQQGMLNNRDLSHPYYWASFVPIGNWAPLPNSH